MDGQGSFKTAEVIGSKCKGVTQQKGRIEGERRNV